MMRIFALAVSLFVVNCGVQASCMKDGTSSQEISLSVEGKDLDRWEPALGQIHRLRLPHGTDVGIQIDSTSDEKYREFLARASWRGIDELVQITIFEMKGDKPVRLTSTWGGANSRQGYGPRGGADSAPLSDQIELWLHKPRCVTLENLKGGK